MLNEAIQSNNQPVNFPAELISLIPNNPNFTASSNFNQRRHPHRWDFKDTIAALKAKNTIEFEKLSC